MSGQENIRPKNGQSKLFNPQSFWIRHTLRATYHCGLLPDLSLLSSSDFQELFSTMLTNTPDLEFAKELATRAESVFGPCASVWTRSKGCWSSACHQGTNTENVDSSLANQSSEMNASLQHYDLRSEQPFVWRASGTLFVAVKTSGDALAPVVVVVSLPNQDDRLICSLLMAHLEALLNSKIAIAAKKQSEFFIDQVTQDFEELTWLRTTNDYFDLCDSQHTIESIAKSCFATLVNVIRAEAILLVRSKESSPLVTGIPDWSRLVSVGEMRGAQDSCPQLLADSIECLSRGPLVRNYKKHEEYLSNYPGIRNCVVLSVSKGEQVYGWIMAINKLPSPDCKSDSEGGETEEVDSLQFRSFEAGLLSAAANIMASQSRNLELFQSQQSLLTGVIRAIINAIDAKDSYTCGHSDRVARYAKRIATRMGLSSQECDRVYMAGLLHDVGKIGVPDSILGKPGPLTPEEFAIVKKHPEIGFNILKHLKQLDYVLPGVLHHHEAVCGKGYPYGLVGEAIPLHGRILAVADAYDAMTSDRPYRPGMPSEKAESILRAGAEKMWDTDIVVVFLECLANDELQPVPNETIPKFGVDSPTAVPSKNQTRRLSGTINSLVVQ